jgi:hypothetical protein
VWRRACAHLYERGNEGGVDVACVRIPCCCTRMPRPRRTRSSLCRVRVRTRAHRWAAGAGVLKLLRSERRVRGGDNWGCR